LHAVVCTAHTTAVKKRECVRREERKKEEDRRGRGEGKGERKGEREDGGGLILVLWLKREIQ
jgi:hypothetical protein